MIYKTTKEYFLAYYLSVANTEMKELYLKHYTNQWNSLNKMGKEWWLKQHIEDPTGVTLGIVHRAPDNEIKWKTINAV